jgi:hypothetical protein
VGTDGKVRLEREMAERVGVPFEDGNWDGVTRKRMKILSAAVVDNELELDQVQLEGEKPQSFQTIA